MPPARSDDSPRPPGGESVARRWRVARIALSIALGLGLLALAAAVVANTRFTLDDATLRDGELTVETDFPAARCAKTLKRAFPFVSFRCDPREGDDGGNGEVDAPLESRGLEPR